MSNKTVPSLQSGIAEERLTYKSPEFRNYYAVAFRLILPTNTLASRVKSFIANYTYGKMAFTIYDNNYYSQEQIIGMINQGKSYHYGFISNAHELTSILHVTHQIINDKDFNDIFVAVPAGDKPKKTTEYQDVNIGTWACGNSSKTIHLPFQRDIPHIYASGVSRSGKSTLLGHIAIERFKKGESVCVIDPHSDLVSNILRMVPGELKDDVVLIDFGIPNATPQITIRDNVDITNPSKVSDDLSEGMRDISTGKEKFFGPKMAYYFNALFFVYSVLPDLHLTHIRELLSRSNKAKTLRTKVSARINHPIVKDFLEEISHTPYESMIPVISRLSHLLLDEGSLRLFTLDENKISIKDIMDNGKLCLISLSVGKIGRQRGSILCSVIDCLIYNNALSRTQLKYQDRKPCTEIVDECQLFPLDFSTKIATVAKLNLSIIAANQFYEQLEPETREAMNSCGSRIAFKVNRNDSEKISRDFNNLNPEELTSLRQFEAFLKIDDEVVKIRTPKLLFNEEDHSQYIIQNCLDKYYIKHEDKKVISKKENLEFDEL